MDIGTVFERMIMRVPVLRRPLHQRNLARAEYGRLASVLQANGIPFGEPAQASANATDPDTRVELRSLSEWIAFAAASPHIFEQGEAARIVHHCQAHGMRSAFLGQMSAEEVKVAGDNYREALLSRGFNPRQRAVLDLLVEAVGGRSIYDVALYAHEAVTPLALRLRGRYPRFLGSEFAASEAERKRIFPIPGIDITASGLPDSSFDIVLSGDVLEHVPDLDAALRDTARILVQGGRLIASFPFSFQEDTEIKARLKDGAIEYLTAPEYHGNPMNPGDGSLVFQIPGWAILAAAKRAGFADACMVFWSSMERGFVGGPGMAGIVVMVATR